MNTEEFDTLLSKLSQDGRRNVLSYIVQNVLVSDEKYFVEKIKVAVS